LRERHLYRYQGLQTFEDKLKAFCDKLLIDTADCKDKDEDKKEAPT
jgi:hypothetical protein